MKQLYPVIHVTDTPQTFVNVEKCLKAHVDGIFLISHGYMKYKELFELAKKVKQQYPTLWIGINCLDANIKTVFDHFTNDMNDYIQGIWFDDSKRGVDKTEADKITASWKHSVFTGELFGGVAFKYCQQPKYIDEAVKESIGNMSVITTSGDGTGVAADLDKVQKMHKALDGNGVLGIASGVDVDNVEFYLPFIDRFLVSTGISIDHSNLDFEKMVQLNKKIKNPL